MAQIDGGIPTIVSKNAKMEGFVLHNRKTSAYFTSDDYLFKGRTSTPIIGEAKTSIHCGGSLRRNGILLNRCKKNPKESHFHALR
jgi:hypothetical protein